MDQTEQITNLFFILRIFKTHSKLHFQIKMKLKHSRMFFAAETLVSQFQSSTNILKLFMFSVKL